MGQLSSPVTVRTRTRSARLLSVGSANSEAMDLYMWLGSTNFRASEWLEPLRGMSPLTRGQTRTTSVGQIVSVEISRPAFASWPLAWARRVQLRGTKLPMNASQPALAAMTFTSVVP